MILFLFLLLSNFSSVYNFFTLKCTFKCNLETNNQTAGKTCK